MAFCSLPPLGAADPLPSPQVVRNRLPCGPVQALQCLEGLAALGRDDSRARGLARHALQACSASELLQVVRKLAQLGVLRAQGPAAVVTEDLAVAPCEVIFAP